MKKNLSFLVGFLFLVIATIAQNQKPRFRIGASAGPAFPMGHFKAPQVFSRYPGLMVAPSSAKNGFSVSLIPSVRLFKGVDAFLLLSASYFLQDEVSMKKYVQDVHSQMSGGGRPLDFQMSMHHWKVYRILPGLEGRFTNLFNTRLGFSPQIAAGIVKAKPPGYTYYYQDSQQSAGGSFGGWELKIAFAYEAGVEVFYELPKNITVNIGANYFKSEPSLKAFEKVKQPVEWWGITAGVAWRF